MLPTKEVWLNFRKDILKLLANWINQRCRWNKWEEWYKEESKFARSHKQRWKSKQAADMQALQKRVAPLLLRKWWASKKPAWCVSDTSTEKNEAGFGGKACLLQIHPHNIQVYQTLQLQKSSALLLYGGTNHVRPENLLQKMQRILQILC